MSIGRITYVFKAYPKSSNIKPLEWKVYYKLIRDRERFYRIVVADMNPDGSFPEGAQDTYFNPALYGFYILMGSKSLSSAITPIIKNVGNPIQIENGEITLFNDGTIKFSGPVFTDPEVRNSKIIEYDTNIYVYVIRTGEPLVPWIWFGNIPAYYNQEDNTVYSQNYNKNSGYIDPVLLPASDIRINYEVSQYNNDFYIRYIPFIFSLAIAQGSPASYLLASLSPLPTGNIFNTSLKYDVINEGVKNFVVFTKDKFQITTKNTKPRPFFRRLGKFSFQDLAMASDLMGTGVTFIFVRIPMRTDTTNYTLMEYSEKTPYDLLKSIFFSNFQISDENCKYYKTTYSKTTLDKLIELTDINFTNLTDENNVYPSVFPLGAGAEHYYLRSKILIGRIVSLKNVEIEYIKTVNKESFWNFWGTTDISRLYKIKIDENNKYEKDIEDGNAYLNSIYKKNNEVNIEKYNIILIVENHAVGYDIVKKYINDNFKWDIYGKIIYPFYNENAYIGSSRIFSMTNFYKETMKFNEATLSVLKEYKDDENTMFVVVRNDSYYNKSTGDEVYDFIKTEEKNYVKGVNLNIFNEEEKDENNQLLDNGIVLNDITFDFESIIDIHNVSFNFYNIENIGENFEYAKVKVYWYDNNVEKILNEFLIHKSNKIYEINLSEPIDRYCIPFVSDDPEIKFRKFYLKYSQKEAVDFLPNYTNFTLPNYSPQEWQINLFIGDIRVPLSNISINKEDGIITFNNKLTEEEIEKGIFLRFTNVTSERNISDYIKSTKKLRIVVDDQKGEGTIKINSFKINDSEYIDNVEKCDFIINNLSRPQTEKTFLIPGTTLWNRGGGDLGWISADISSTGFSGGVQDRLDGTVTSNFISINPLGYSDLMQGSRILAPSSTIRIINTNMLFSDSIPSFWVGSIIKKPEPLIGRIDAHKDKYISNQQIVSYNNGPYLHLRKTFYNWDTDPKDDETGKPLKLMGFQNNTDAPVWSNELKHTNDMFDIKVDKNKTILDIKSEFVGDFTDKFLVELVFCLHINNIYDDNSVIYPNIKNGILPVYISYNTYDSNNSENTYIGIENSEGEINKRVYYLKQGVNYLPMPKILGVQNIVIEDFLELYDSFVLYNFSGGFIEDVIFGLTPMYYRNVRGENFVLFAGNDELIINGRSLLEENFSKEIDASAFKTGVLFSDFSVEERFKLPRAPKEIVGSDAYLPIFLPLSNNYVSLYNDDNKLTIFIYINPENDKLFCVPVPEINIDANLNEETLSGDGKNQVTFQIGTNPVNTITASDGRGVGKDPYYLIDGKSSLPNQIPAGFMGKDGIIYIFYSVESGTYPNIVAKVSGNNIGSIWQPLYKEDYGKDYSVIFDNSTEKSSYKALVNPYILYNKNLDYIHLFMQYISTIGTVKILSFNFSRISLFDVGYIQDKVSPRLVVGNIFNLQSVSRDVNVNIRIGNSSTPGEEDLETPHFIGGIYQDDGILRIFYYNNNGKLTSKISNNAGETWDIDKNF